MVKPPRTMQPEHVNLAEAGRKAGRAFQKDSFHHYMARKIDLQRQQFGLVALPPPPPSVEHNVHPNHNETTNDTSSSQTSKTSSDTTTPRKVQFMVGTKQDHDRAHRSREMRALAKARARTTGGGNSQRITPKNEPPTLSRKRKRKIEFENEANDDDNGINEGVVDPTKRPCVDSRPNTAHKTTLEPSAVDKTQGRVGKATTWSRTPRSKVQGILKVPRLESRITSDVDSDGEENSRQVSGQTAGNSTSYQPPTNKEKSPLSSSISSSRPSDAIFPSPSLKHSRPDLFFLGVVVKVQGNSNPDNESLKRMLQCHGGDLETYETSRVTHLVAENLSTAKAKYLRSQKRPRPVCHPNWIVDSVRAKRLMPHGEYLLPELKDDYHDGGGSKQLDVKAMFEQNRRQQQQQQQQQQKSEERQTREERPAADRGRPEQDMSLSADLRAGAFNPITCEELEICKSPTKGPADSGGSCESPTKAIKARKDTRLINGKIRTVGTDPNFLDSYFSNSRLSFIGSYKQRMASASPSKKTPCRTDASKNATRLVFHIDMDCFFAAVVLRNYPEYKDKPVVISHLGNRSHENKDAVNTFDPSRLEVKHIPKGSTSECATCNYEARKFGIKKGMFLSRAKALCPDVVVLSYDFEGYEAVSQQVEEIVDKVAMQYHGVVEAVSCDEAYVEMFFEGRADFDSVHDRAFDVAERIRAEILKTTQCTASIGVAKNKFLAKLGGEKVKPNGSYVVREYQELLQDLRLRDLHGVGWRTEPKLAEEGLFTVQDVWNLGPKAGTELIRILGKATGKKIFDFCHGSDDRPVKPAERKTIGAECNYGVRFDGPYGIDHFMEGLANEVNKRMEGCGVKGGKLTLRLKKRKENAGPPPKFLGHGSCYNLSKSIDTPLTREAPIIKKFGMTAFKALAVQLEDVRGMGISMSKLRVDDGPDFSSTSHMGMQHWLNGDKQAQDRRVRSEGKNEMIVQAGINAPGGATADRTESQDLAALAFEASNEEFELDDRDGASEGGAETVDSMKQRPAQKKRPRPPNPLLSRNNRNRFLQTDLKRMMKLAAVQSGKEQTGISLTELDHLPLEVKLQVVNDDDQKLGSVCSAKSAASSRLSPERRWKRATVEPATVTGGISPAGDDLGGNMEALDIFPSSPQTSTATSADGITNNQTRCSQRKKVKSMYRPIEKVNDIYRQDILPLRLFLDENPPENAASGRDEAFIGSEPSAIKTVVEFLTIVLKEGRLSDLTSLICSVRNRDDQWSETTILRRIVQDVDKEHTSLYGTHLDVDWLAGNCN